MTLQDRIDGLNKMLTTYQGAPVWRKPILAKAILAKGALLDTATKQLEAQTNKQWDWLNAHRDHPEYAARDQRLADQVGQIVAAREVLVRALIAQGG